MDQAKVEALRAKALSEGGISQEESQALFDHHRTESLANTIDELWQAYDAAWHIPQAQAAIQEALEDLLFEQALAARKK